MKISVLTKVFKSFLIIVDSRLRGRLNFLLISKNLGMSATSFECTLCALSFTTTEDWFLHLLKEEHQIQVRKECHQWFKDDNVKDRVLVTLSKYWIPGSIILEYFSKWETSVADFVWWPNHPTLRFRLLQLKTREEVDQLLKTRAQTTVDNQPVRLKRMNEYYQFEWDDLIPRPNAGVSLTSYQIKADDGVSPSTDLLKLNLSAASKLSEQFTAVMKKMDSSNEYRIAEKIKDRIQFVCLKNLRDIHDDDNCSWRVSFFRHWHLGYKNSGKNEFLFFLEIRGKKSCYSKSTTLIENFNFEELLSTKDAQRNFRSLPLEKVDEDETKFGPSVDTNSLTKLYQYTSEREVVKFYLSSDLRLAPEMYACNLLRCICKFEPHVTPLIYLVSSWAQVNNLVLGNFTETDMTEVEGHLTPEPALLEWLVVFFCCVKGMIPTPRYLKNKRHPRVMCQGVDISYSSKNDAIMDWTDFTKKFRDVKRSFPSNISTETQFVLNICRYAKEFFEFCANFCSEPCILNMRDGQVITEKEFHRQLDGEEATWALKKLTKEEIQNVKTKLETESPLTIIHPLIDSQRFSFDREKFVSKTCKIMKSTTEKLETLCKNQLENSEDDGSMTLQAALLYK